MCMSFVYINLFYKFYFFPLMYFPPPLSIYYIFLIYFIFIIALNRVVCILYEIPLMPKVVAKDNVETNAEVNNFCIIYKCAFYLLPETLYSRFQKLDVALILHTSIILLMLLLDIVKVVFCRNWR